MPPLDARQLQHLAQLARLSLTPSQLALLQPQLGDVVTYVQSLATLERAQEESPEREVLSLALDIPRPSQSPAEALRSAVSKRQGFLVVPLVLPRVPNKGGEDNE